MEYGDIYYIDDARNASRDHRTTGGTVFAGSSRPAMVPAGQPSRTFYAAPAAPAGAYSPTYVPRAPMVYGQPGMYPEPQLTAGSLLGRLPLAQLVEIAAQVFAALQALPPAPSPTSETATDVHNLITYQSALAAHAKRDEQVRTLGNLVARLAG
jgi:hypothetical protein